MVEGLIVPYIKDKDGNLLPVAAIYDKDGNDITQRYQVKTGLSIGKDSDGYIVVNED